jgi:hypothetical protein
VLYPNLLRDLLIRVAQAGLVQAKWTNEILEETFRNVKEDRPDLDLAMLDRTRELMGRAIRDVLIKDYEPLIPMLELPDANDRHVLAAAIKARTVQAQIDAQQAPGSTSTERQRIKDLEREVRDRKEANEILKAASIFFARELDPRHR